MEFMILHVIFLFLKRNCYAYWAMLYTITITYNKTISVLMHACVYYDLESKKKMSSHHKTLYFTCVLLLLLVLVLGFRFLQLGLTLNSPQSKGWPWIPEPPSSCPPPRSCLLNEYWDWDYGSFHSLLGVIFFSFTVAICVFYWNWWRKVDLPTSSKSQRFMKEDIRLFTGGLSLGRRPPCCPSLFFLLLREADL